MPKFIYLLVLLVACRPQTSIDLETVFESSGGLESADYDQGMKWWRKLEKVYPMVTIDSFGMSDAGLPIHLISIASHKQSVLSRKDAKLPLVLINNGIHPGEPDGVDASMLFVRDLLQRRPEIFDSVQLALIPFYNIGGALNRNSHSRANQQGPKEYGFRGNAQNLDLNRDFVKCDSKNALAFSRLLNQINPDVYVETHVSNGADYPYNMTYLATQPNKLGYVMGPYLADTLIPTLEDQMKKRNNEMVPYVNLFGTPLDTSYFTFYDLPRYSTGLTTLFHSFGFITETHMLKEFPVRVNATYDFLVAITHITAERGNTLIDLRRRQGEIVKQTASFPLDWKLDSTRSRELRFNAFEFGYKASEVTGSDRLYYDRTKPITKTVHFYHAMVPKTYRKKPKAYLIKGGYWRVLDRLRILGVQMDVLQKDTVLPSVSYRISNYQTASNAYESHYLHHTTSFTSDTSLRTFIKGDVLIQMGTDKDRLLIELLEPDAPDSYFNWNFFDAVLQQKEWYSPYIFEDEAAHMLQEDTSLMRRFEEKKASDPLFSNDANAQLYWIYTQSKHFEDAYMRLPVFRLEE